MAKTLKEFRFTFGSPGLPNEGAFVLRFDPSNGEDMSTLPLLTGGLAARYGQVVVESWNVQEGRWEAFDTVSRAAMERWIKTSVSPHSAPLNLRSYLG